MMSVNELENVNPLQGTDSQEDFSRGNTLPLVCTPFPMTAWTLQTDAGRWAFRWRDGKVQGLRATHQPSPWMGDHGQFTVLPQTGELSLGAHERASGYDKHGLIVRPHYLRARLLRYGCVLEATPTERCSKLRFAFERDRAARLVVDCFTADGELQWDAERKILWGCSRSNHGGVPENFALWFAIRIHADVQGFRFGGRGNGHGPQAVTGAVEFSLRNGERVECDIATSYISVEQALVNMDREIGGRSFDEVKDAAAKAWNERLGIFRINAGDAARRRTFYSCVYRTLTFPQKMHEVEAGGRTVHYSPYSGRIEEGVLYAGHGFWDTYRTAYPFYALFYPKDYAEFLQGWINACEEGGWYPRWPSPGYRVCMLGTHVDVVFADAVAKGIGGFDLAKAYRGLRRHAFECPETDLGYGRPGLYDYLKYGYLPSDRYRHSVSATLDHAYCDFCLGQIAEKLGELDDANVFRGRALNYRHLFDPNTGFMRAKKTDGGWEEPFHEYEWGGAYIESAAWQASWGVPHDVKGLIRLHGGRENFLTRLDQVLATKPYFEVGDYGFEIHEMTEMAAANFGQYAHSNQPVHHLLYLFAEAGAGHKTEHWVRRILTEYYNDTPGGFPGDEDNGEMAAWYVLSALGLFPLCPGKARYTLTRPLFSEASVTLGSGAVLNILDGDLERGVSTVPGEFLYNGESLEGWHISHEQVMAGGSLVYQRQPRRGERAEEVLSLKN